MSTGCLMLPIIWARDYPTVDDGLRGMLFIEATVKSDRSARKWLKVLR